MAKLNREANVMRRRQEKAARKAARKLAAADDSAVDPVAGEGVTGDTDASGTADEQHPAGSSAENV